MEPNGTDYSRQLLALQTIATGAVAAALLSGLAAITALAWKGMAVPEPLAAITYACTGALTSLLGAAVAARRNGNGPR